MRSAELAVQHLILLVSFTSALDKELTISSKLLLDEIVYGPDDSINWLAVLCDDFGPRKTGSYALEEAIDWVVKSLRSDGLRVHAEPVPMLPNWTRGDDSAYVIEPRTHKLNILAIGGSSPGVVEGEVVIIRRIEELQTRSVHGKIVVTSQDWTGYREGNRLRRAAREAAGRGALALLVKSVTPTSLYTPHTGAGARGATIPAACITTEEADMITRWVNRGKKVTIKLEISSAESPDPVLSRNVVFEIPGSLYPEEVVVVSAHIDSWDVGQGALDDGGGMAAVRAALLAIARLSRSDPTFRPKRTIRGIFWTAEEQGSLGSAYYFRDHLTAKERFVFASESDQGALRPQNYRSVLRYQGDHRHKTMIEEIVSVLNANGIPLRVRNSTDQVDVSIFANGGVPSVNYESDRGNDFYFRFHHSNADYVSVFDKDDIKYTAAIFAVLAHNVANLEDW